MPTGRLQPRILRFGLLQDGEIGVSVLSIAPGNCDMRRELLRDLPANARERRVRRRGSPSHDIAIIQA